MAVDIFPTATTEIADLVLPAAAALEAVDYRAYFQYPGRVSGPSRKSG